jgi:hypothetical protein
VWLHASVEVGDGVLCEREEVTVAPSRIAVIPA